ncbi:hypothetical protein [Sphaerisporangium sp. TRM90804]|uniref:hypothetical protein n=1 Tax=Sphaerisporangium sp. TRM90804 TaxID=3031113 RepID=UPI002447EC73|nr:hypothetical protein [Sphaerisporangium sp. TRM90804]MDH2429774.1 hypothetical protein [Sphaerisporangium sp. TRM90804]
MSSGYSYTSISMRPGQSPVIAMSFYPDEYARAQYYPATDDAHAFVSVDHGDARVSIGTTSKTKVTDAHVRFARDLFDAAARFLADCERLRDEHAGDSGDTGTGTGTGKATPGKAA